MEKKVIELIVLSYTDATSERLGDGDDGYNFSRNFELYCSESVLEVKDVNTLNKLSELLQYKEWFELNCCYGAGETKGVFPNYYFDTNRQIDKEKTRAICELLNSKSNEVEYIMCLNFPKLITKKRTQYIESYNPHMDIPWEIEETLFDVANSSCPHHIYPFKSISCY